VTVRLLAVLVATLLCRDGLAQPVRVRVGWPAPTVSSAAAPFAAAVKMGWYAAEGLELELVPLAGSVDGVRHVAVRTVDYALASPEAVAVARAGAARVRTFYTAYQGNIFGVAVPAESPVRTVADLRGRTIGVLSLGSTGVLVARALAVANGLDPERDIRLAVVGQGAQAAALLRSRQVDALSQSDVQLALVEMAGIPLRRLETPEIQGFPSDGFVALDETLASRRREAVGVARAYAKGTVLALANPALAVRHLHDVFPETRPTGPEPVRADRDVRRVLEVRLKALALERSGVSRWGETSVPGLTAYLDLLARWGVLGRPMAATEVFTGELLADINDFDAARIAREAREAPPGN